MGNLCGKQSKEGFDGPGRTLGSAPAPATKASVPKNAASTQKRTVGGPPRTLGESNSQEDPKSAAAAAAEARATKHSTGSLQKKLDAQKKQSHSALLRDVSDQTLDERKAKKAREEMRHD